MEARRPLALWPVSVQAAIRRIILLEFNMLGLPPRLIANLDDAGITDPDTLADLARCTELELESSRAVKGLLGEPVAI